MKINAALVIEQRLRRAWTQERLARASGLSPRTIQRVEREAAGSLETKQALAATLEIDASDLDYEESPTVKKYEYKMVELPIKMGLFKPKTPDIESLLNAEGDVGWRLREIVLPASTFGESGNIVVLLEREKI
jgi:transcriptional regulator with XRE-family HTH domain